MGLCEWSQNDGIIKATPHKLLSDSAHKIYVKVFKGLGGGLVSRNGEHWYETARPRRVELPFSVYEEA